MLRLCQISPNMELRIPDVTPPSLLQTTTAEHDHTTPAQDESEGDLTPLLAYLRKIQSPPMLAIASQSLYRLIANSGSDGITADQLVSAILVSRPCSVLILCAQDFHARGEDSENWYTALRHLINFRLVYETAAHNQRYGDCVSLGRDDLAPHAFCSAQAMGCR